MYSLWAHFFRKRIRFQWQTLLFIATVQIFDVFNSQNDLQWPLEVTTDDVFRDRVRLPISVP